MPDTPPRPRRPRPGGARRRRSVLLELVAAAGICFAGFYFAADWLRVREAAWVAGALRLLGAHRVSGVLPGHILIFRADGSVLNALVTPSCSAILSVVGLTALTVAVLRGRRLHAAAGLAVAAAAVVAANDLRLAGSTLAGLWWGRGALVLFHDWVGTLWNFAATLAGFLLMVCLTLPTAERAEQDVAGRHTARRPGSWARPGLGYRLPELDGRAAATRRTFTGLVYRYLLPGSVTRRLAARREAGRIDYRIGHLSAAQRIAAVQALAADGLGTHTASLLGLATYDEDPRVLDALAAAVAARTGDPAHPPRLRALRPATRTRLHRVAALRLWARGWLLGRGAPAAELAHVDGVRPEASLAALPTGRRAAAVRGFVAAGLGVRTGRLLAVAAHDCDPAVLDALADAIAARQWEPVENDQISALRLWARGWTAARPSRFDELVRPVTGQPAVPAPARRPAPATAAAANAAAGSAVTVAPRSVPARRSAAVPAGAAPDRPRSFAAAGPARTARPHRAEDPR